MGTRCVAYGVLTIYDDYLLVRRSDVQTFCFSDIIRRERSEGGDDVSHISHLSPLRFLLSLAVLGKKYATGGVAAGGLPAIYVSPVEVATYTVLPRKRKKTQGEDSQGHGGRGDRGTGDSDQQDSTEHDREDGTGNMSRHYQHGSHEDNIQDLSDSSFEIETPTSPVFMVSPSASCSTGRKATKFPLNS